jgi:hypothetical protein
MPDVIYYCYLVWSQSYREITEGVFTSYKWGECKRLNSTAPLRDFSVFFLVTGESSVGFNCCSSCKFLKDFNNLKESDWRKNGEWVS